MWSSMKDELEAICKEVRNCTRCALAGTRTQALCGEGDPSSGVMLVAQAPGEREDKEGRMFVGPSGGVLNEVFARIGVNRGKIYMTNLVKCMLPGYRRPRQQEIAECSRYLEKEMEVVNPKLLVPLGFYAIRYLFNRFGLHLPPKAEFSSLYGRVFHVQGRVILPLRHPTAALYNKSVLPQMVDTYRGIKNFLESGL